MKVKVETERKYLTEAGGATAVVITKDLVVQRGHLNLELDGATARVANASRIEITGQTQSHLYDVVSSLRFAADALEASLNKCRDDVSKTVLD